MEDAKVLFEELGAILEAHEPLGLLTQLTMTFLFISAGEFYGEDSDPVLWQKYIEFMTGYLLVRPYPSPAGAPTDGATLKEVEQMITAYYLAHDFADAALGKPEPESAENLLLRLVRSHARHVRGLAYPHQLYEYARSLYSPHDDWFRKNLGFTIDDAIRIAEAISKEYSDRKFASKQAAIEQARRKADELIASGEATEGDRPRVEVAYGCYFHFGNSVNVLGFTPEQLCSLAGVRLEVASKFLSRMSQPFGYHNPDFPNTFTDAYTAPTDYNTLNERPIVTHDGRYWLLVLPTLKSALATTFYFDLIRDKAYKPIFDRERAAWLEKETAAYLSRLFPTDTVYLNPFYPKGEEFSDVLVLHDRKILVVQCKSKGLTHAANIGDDIEKLRSDLKKGVKEAFEQGVRAREYLLASEEPEILLDGKPFAIDMRQVNAIHIISVTLMPFQTLATRFANHPELKLFQDAVPLWSLSLGSLDVLTLILQSPARLLHYLNRRLQIENTVFSVHADEMDLLGYYLAQGMYFSDEELKNINALGLAGLSSNIDEYIYQRFELGQSPPIPKAPMPPGFEDFLNTVEHIGGDYSTDCAIALLDLSYNARKEFMQAVEQTKSKARVEGGRPIASMLLRGGKAGLSFLVLPAGTSAEQLSEDTMAQAVIKKHTHKCDAWVSFGWVVGSIRPVDTAGYVSFD